MTVFLAAQDDMEMYFNGPMRSGIVLDSQALLKADYRRFQLELADKLKDMYIGHWECPAFQQRRNHLAFDVDNLQGETVIPRYLISRRFEDEDLAEILNEFHLEAEVLPSKSAYHDYDSEREGLEQDRHNAENRRPMAKFNIKELDIRLYDYGYASCMIYGTVTALKDLTLEEYRQAVELISSSLPDYTELLQSTIGKIAEVIPPQFIVLTYHGGDKPQDAWPNSALGQHVGELFWVHRVFSVPCADWAEFEQRKAECRSLVYNPRNTQAPDKSLRNDMAVYAGHGNSCVVYIKDVTTGWSMTRLKSVIRAKNVFYAALQDVDRDLFYLGNELALHHDTGEMEFLERGMRFMSDTLARTGFIKSVYDDYDNQLDPQSMAIWDHLRMAWMMGDLFRALDQKTVRMDKAYDRTSQRLAALQSRKIYNLIAVFIAVAVAALAWGLADSVPELKNSAPGWVRAIVLAFALGAATLFTVRYSKTK